MTALLYPNICERMEFYVEVCRSVSSVLLSRGPIIIIHARSGIDVALRADQANVTRGRRGFKFEELERRPRIQFQGDTRNIFR